MSDECETNVENAMDAVYAAKAAIESVTGGCTPSTRTPRRSSTSGRPRSRRRWNAAQAAAQAIWTADQSCGEGYPELYQAYSDAADAATNCSTARVGQNYETYIDTAHTQLDAALAKFPW